MILKFWNCWIEKKRERKRKFSIFMIYLKMLCMTIRMLRKYDYHSRENALFKKHKNQIRHCFTVFALNFTST